MEVHEMKTISTRFLNTFPPDEMLRHSYLMAEKSFRIWGNLYFVGNSWCSSHLIDTGEGLILLDTPCLAELPYLLDSIWAAGFDPRSIKIILISHAHHDHYGAASALQHITGAEIYFGALDAEDMKTRAWWFEEHNRERIPEEDCFQADRLLNDGDMITLGNTEIKCILTPGHTLGTMSHFFNACDGNGNTVRVGIYGGSGFGTVRTEFLNRAKLPLSLQDEFVQSIDKVINLPIDLTLGNHPCHNDTFDKFKRICEGETDAFINPGEWKGFLTELKESYLTFMKLTPEEQAELYLESHFADYCGPHALRWFK